MGRGRYVHPTRSRIITPHKVARLQGFPDYFAFSSLVPAARHYCLSSFRSTSCWDYLISRYASRLAWSLLLRPEKSRIPVAQLDWSKAGRLAIGQPRAPASNLARHDTVTDVRYSLLH